MLLTGLSGISVPVVDGFVKCTISPKFDNHNIQVNAWILPKIVGYLPACCLGHQLKQHFSHLALADSDFDRSNPVDLLLEADVFSQIMNGKQVVINDFLPTAFKFLFERIVIGPVEGFSSEPYH